MDLPSFRKMYEEMLSAEALATMVMPGMLDEVRTLRRNLTNIANAIDSFYEVLGSRHWVFHESLPMTEIEALTKLEAPTAEAALIEMYQSDMGVHHSVRRLVRFEQMRPRLALVKLAQDDYEAGRYEACTLILLTVMDGFVNDVESSHRGLHTRDSDEMNAWNSVAGHQYGLGHAHRSFTKNFSVRNDEEVFELHRNGIVHGVLTNYGNVVVATKAWNRLFAVGDWAQSLGDAQEPEPTVPTWSETLSTLRITANRQALIAAWNPRTTTAANGIEGEASVSAAHAFFGTWQRRNFGGMTAFARPYPGEKKHAQTLKNLFKGYALSGFEITEVELTKPAIALVRATLTINGTDVSSESRWSYEGADGHSLVESEPGGHWRLVFAQPDMFADGVAAVYDPTVG